MNMTRPPADAPEFAPSVEDRFAVYGLFVDGVPGRTLADPPTEPEPAPVDPIHEAEVAEERQARLVARYAIPAAVWALVVVGLYCNGTPEGAYRRPGELLLVLVATILGSLALTFVTRVLTREPRP